MGQKPILLILFQYMTSSWSPIGDPSWSVAEHALSLCFIYPRNGAPLWTSDRAGFSPAATPGNGTTGEDAGEDQKNIILKSLCLGYNNVNYDSSI